jgi:hypothetical protein
LIAGGLAVLGIVGSFVLPPPVAVAGGTPWRRLAQFVAAVLIALMFVATRRIRSGGRALWWWVALSSLGLAVLTVFWYDHLTRAWTCAYDDDRVIVGTEYTAQGREHRRQDPGAGCETLIQDFAGRVEDIWVSDGIRLRQSAMATVYVGAVALFTICMVGVVAAISEVEGTSRSSRPVDGWRDVRIFISYRRDDSAGQAGRLHDHLAARFGPDRVFRDVVDIVPGEDFQRAIERAVGASDVLLAVIGPQWLTIRDAMGGRRLDDSGDLVRLEVATALARGVRVIPVLLERTTMPTGPDLPGPLGPLARRNALELRDTAWEQDVSRLVAALEGGHSAARSERPPLSA